MQNGIALAKGSRLEEYEIEGELGSGTFGVTYLATDTNLGRKVVIKEYLPNEIAIRQDINTIIPKSQSDQENFDYGLESFIKEAKVLARFNHPNIVKVNRLFEAKIFASGSSDNTAKIFDINTGKVLKTFKRFFQGHIAPVLSTCMSQDNQLLVSSSADWSIKIWDIEHKIVKHNLLGHTDAVTSVVISNDSKNLISGSLDKTIKVWDLASGKLIKTLEGHTEGVTSVAISQCNTIIVSGSLDRTIKVWEKGKVLKTLTGHKYYINDVKISNDGNLIISGGGDCSVRIWDSNSGNLLQTLQNHTMPVKSVAVNHNNTVVVSASEDKTIKVWDIKLLREGEET